ncbi:hypothetical protein BJ963_003368 [Leifsonia soli]|uniref:Uncharacterized protein n=1 Tax=Leifsonia soli TaxID=582665 RepID=A0A852T2Y0_9MICO|nr:hypothetical protein [Leifsonia soli]
MIAMMTRPINHNGNYQPAFSMERWNCLFGPGI